MRYVAVDFETEAIQGNPILKPPRPVGVAIYEEGNEPTYTGDFSVVSNLWADGSVKLIFHNAPFDTRVAEKHLGLAIPDWSRIHDTQYLLYLDDPYAKSLSLKPAAERYLGLPPEEQDELHQWILANVSGATHKNAGAFISLAPMELIARYAKGDVIRTVELFKKLHPTVPTEAYDRERQLSPILVQATQRGICVQRDVLEQDTARCADALAEADNRVRRILGKEINVGSTDELGRALFEADLVTEWVLTPTGKRSTAKKNIVGRIKNKELEELILYRSTMETCVGTFMRPWLGFSQEDNRLHPEWHQTRNDDDNGKFSGTRTGRMSCGNPNMQNPPNTLDLPTPEGLVPLPDMRSYLLPEEGHIWLKRDFSQQELRILAHFEEGALFQAYKENPNLDPHSMAKEMILQTTGQDFERKHVKITAFQIVYGGGPKAIASQVGCSLEEATRLRNAYLAAFPGVGQLMNLTKRRGEVGQPIKTWGGRVYYVEPPRMVNGYRRTFAYKLLNYLIQGSAADQTKKCIIDWHSSGTEAVYLAAVHDDINISAPVETWHDEMQNLKEVMNQDLFDVPMLSEGFAGLSWGSVEGVVE